MRIFTKKAFKFMNRENGSFVKTQPFSFQDVPEWVKKDPIYALAVKEGSIETIESKQRQKQLENDPNARKTGKKPPKNQVEVKPEEGKESPNDSDKEGNSGENEGGPEGTRMPDPSKA